MQRPFPFYERELEAFIEITPEIARREFKWLCKNDKYKSISEYPLCRESCYRQNQEATIKGRSKELASLGRGNSKRIIQKGAKETMPNEKEVEQKPKSTFDEWWDKLEDENEDNITQPETVITYD